MVIEQRLLGRAVLVSFALFVTLGLPDGVFGTIWPSMRNDFGRSDGSFGLVILFSAVGYTVSSLGAGHLCERFGSGIVLRNATVAAIAGLALVAAAPTWWTVMFGFVVLGAGWGLSDATANAWMALTQTPRQMGLLHAAYGAGAFLGPLLATIFVAGGEQWRAPYAVVAGLGVVLIVVMTTAREGFDSAPVTAEVASSPAPARGSGTLLALLITWFSIYVGIEVTVGQWSYTLLTEGRGESEVTAGVLVALFWGGLMVGRFGLAGFGHRVAPERLLNVAIVATAVGVSVFWADIAGVGAYVLPLIGLSLSTMFPLVMGRTAVYLGEARAARAVGYQMAASSVGFVALPALVGVLADQHGVTVTLPVTFAATIVLGAVWAIIQRRVAPTRTPARAGT